MLSDEASDPLLIPSLPGTEAEGSNLCARAAMTGELSHTWTRPFVLPCKNGNAPRGPRGDDHRRRGRYNSSMLLLDGKKLAQTMQAEIARQTQDLAASGIRPGLAAVL